MLAHEPTDANRQAVQLHATVGTTQAMIADILGIDDKTLRLHYRVELNQAKSKANATIGGALYNKAKGGDTAAMIFWMKTQAGWREKQDIDHTVKVEDDGGAFARLAQRLASAATGTAGSTDGA